MNGLQAMTAMGVGTAQAVSATAGTAGSAGSKADALLAGGGFASVISRIISEGTGTTEGTVTLSQMLAMMPSELSDLLATESDEAEQVDWSSILEQLAAYLSELPSNLLQQLEEQPEVREWMALVEAELVMAGEVAPLMDMNSSAQSEGTESGESMTGGLQKPAGILDTLNRFFTAINANPESMVWPAVVEQGAKAIMKAAPSLTAETSAVSIMQADDMRLMQGNAKVEKSPTAALAQLTQWISEMNGNVQKPDAANAEDKAIANARVSFMAAMEAKSGYFRYITAEADASISGLEANHASLTNAVDGETPSVQWSGMDMSRPVTADAGAKAEAMPQRVPITNLFEQLSQWMMKKSAGGDQLRTETLIRLVPEHLGSVNVKLSILNGQLTASITTETAMAKEVLESNLAVLRTNLQNQGVTVERLTVTQQPANEHASSSFHDSRREQSSNQNPERRSSSGSHESSEDWLDFLGMKSEVEETPIPVNGSSFQAQA